jgi:hypothetical protein
LDEPATRDTIASVVFRDLSGSLLFGFSLFLIVLLSVAGVIFARTGHLELLKAALVLTMAFSVIGAVFGLVRGLRSGRATIR